MWARHLLNSDRFLVMSQDIGDSWVAGDAGSRNGGGATTVTSVKEVAELP